MEEKDNIIDLGDSSSSVVKISDEVVSTIAGIAASEIDGVFNTNNGIVNGIVEMLGMKSNAKGVKVEVGQEETRVNVGLVIKYGYKIPEVCAKVQENVKSAVETMTGLKVVEVNIHVQGIHFEREIVSKQEVIEEE